MLEHFFIPYILPNIDSCFYFFCCALAFPNCIIDDPVWLAPSDSLEAVPIPPAPCVNSYGSSDLLTLNKQYAQNDDGNRKYLEEFVDLKVDWPTLIKADPVLPLSENLPYADLMTGRITQEGIPEKYWTNSVNQTLFNLSINQSSMATLQKAVLVPFGGNPNWTSQLQQATSPDLLRLIVMQQAVNNALTYQLLQRENDRALMQASELRMLNELNVTMVNLGEEQIRQQQRIVNALQQSKTN